MWDIGWGSHTLIHLYLLFCPCLYPNLHYWDSKRRLKEVSKCNVPYQNSFINGEGHDYFSYSYDDKIQARYVDNTSKLIML
jgi:hypothetical protein